MPDFDSGHIFLTTLAPIKPGSVSEREGGTRTSHVNKVRSLLSLIPPAMQSPATQQSGLNSPFALNRRNHLARMFVLDDVVFNGRTGSNAIVTAIDGADPVNPQEVDQLPTAYLVFCADVDAVMEDGQKELPKELTNEQQREVRASYAMKLWETMGETLQEIYANCVDFESVTDKEGFARYLEWCHVETTMPFHDYYLTMPKFHLLPVKRLGLLVGVPLLVTLFGLFARLFGELTFWGMSTLGMFAIGGAATTAAMYIAVRMVIANGRKPLPPGEFDDLPSVLKALYIQQKFADFVIDHQGASSDTLKEAFGTFLATHKPYEKTGPTQTPGVISASAPGGLQP